MRLSNVMVLRFTTLRCFTMNPWAQNSAELSMCLLPKWFTETKTSDMSKRKNYEVRGWTQLWGKNPNVTKKAGMSNTLCNCQLNQFTFKWSSIEKEDPKLVDGNKKTWREELKLLEHVVGLLPVVRANYGVGREGNGSPKDGTEGLLVRMGHTWVTRVGRSKHFLHSCKFFCRLLAESNQMGCNQSKSFKATTSWIRTLPYLQTVRRMQEKDELKPYHHPILFFSLFSSTTT